MIITVSEKAKYNLADSKRFRILKNRISNGISTRQDREESLLRKILEQLHSAEISEEEKPRIKELRELVTQKLSRFPSAILDLIHASKNPTEVRELISAGKTKTKFIALFEPQKAFGGKSLFYRLQENHFDYHYRRLWHWEDFLAAGVIDFNERDESGRRLMTILLQNRDQRNVTRLLKFGDFVSEKEYELTEGTELRDFLNYQPGLDEPTIYELVNDPKERKREDYPEKVAAMLADQADTTDEESTDSEVESSIYDLSSDSEEEEYPGKISLQNRIDLYNEGESGCENLALVEYRGLHFKKGFSLEEKERIKAKKFESEDTFSLAIKDPAFQEMETHEESSSSSEEEIESPIKRRRVKQIKTKWKETEKAEDDPSKYKTIRSFERLSFRLMQQYIMAFKGLVIKGSIQSVYGFPSAKNPFLSLTRFPGKAILYGSGVRHEKIESIFRNPHYRRFTGRPKHPVTGYVEVYVFDPEYARKNSYNRDILYSEGKISLKQTYLNGEGERLVIAHIPKRYHRYRFFIVFPNFSNKLTYKKWKEKYGLRVQSKSFEKIQKILRSPDRGEERKKKYLESLLKIAQWMDKYCGPRISEWIRHSIFNREGKIVVHDHPEGKLSLDPFMGYRHKPTII
ncbi:MAG: hypothetical protein JW855_05315 [Gammaproteobacteria bacterium]|nr:hypothetical protein [Gammaproteobacteria bacterium]